jgi:Leucine-rich repeat (LRR) protein
VFTDLENLVYLNLDSNQISSLKNVQFNPKLVDLTLRYNMLTNLSEISSNSSLKVLKASNNRIQEINFKIENLAMLEHLDLSQNRLISLKEDAFTNLKQLRYLNLSQNKLDFNEDNSSYFKSQSLLESLDLSFNEIEYFISNCTFQHLSSLKALDLSNNKLKAINSFTFEYLNQLNKLNLASNGIKLLNETSFSNLSNLKMLWLNSNQINSLIFLNASNHYNLEFIDLEQNKIVTIEENDFKFNLKLSFLNLNSNPIEKIELGGLNFLTTLKLSNTSISAIFVNSSLKELDLSCLNVSVTLENNNVEWIKLANASLNVSFGIFLNNSTKYVDFSFNDFSLNDFSMFKVLDSALETLKLRKTNLQEIDQINLKNLINLKYLDLASNNLSFISQMTFEYTQHLEYLDLSSNRLLEFSFVLNNLKYLNLENNQINSSYDTLKSDFYSIEILKMSNNHLLTYPSFEIDQITNNSETFLELHLQQNHLSQIKYFSFIFGSLELANFDTNYISLIEVDAFLNCRSLESLSIASNKLN